MGITKEQIARINELYHRSKLPEGLSPEEAQEQQMLRRAYIDAVKENLSAHLDRIELVDPKPGTESPNPVSQEL